MIHLLPDDFLGLERLGEIRLACGDPELVALNTSQLDGQRLGPEDLEATVAALPFLAEKRLVIVRRLAAQFEARARELGYTPPPSLDNTRK